ncbi:MAG: lysophospholipid acyltransferase family protein [Rhodothermales bacterium]
MIPDTLDTSPDRYGRISYAAPEDPWPKRFAIRAIERLSGRPAIERRYRALRARLERPSDFWQAALDALGVALRYDERRLAAVPADGPLVVVANHPLGVVDGLALCALGNRLRPRFQILTNRALCTDPMLDPYLLPVDFAETREATRTNIATKQAALETLSAGGALLIFPAGGIATATGWRGPVVDLPWKRFAARLIQASGATVVPIFFYGQNSRLFQLVSQFSLTLRLALILHEVRRHRGRPLRIAIGEPIPFHDLAHLQDRQALLDVLRQRVEALESG